MVPPRTSSFNRHENPLRRREPAAVRQVGAAAAALRAAEIDEVVVHTGQHYDRELSQVVVEELGLAEPRYGLDLQRWLLPT